VVTNSTCEVLSVVLFKFRHLSPKFFKALPWFGQEFAAMDRSTVSSSAVKCMFLGSKDKLIVAGDAPNANVQILYSHEGGGDGDALQTAAELDFHGHCTDLELCGIARLAQTYGAIALWEPLKGKSSLSLFNIDTQLDHASMQELRGSLYNDTCAISSITFSPDMEFLAVGTEAGLVSILDIHSGKALSTFKVDPCGVAKVKFMRTGQLITVGESPKAQIKIWDLRAAAGMDGESGVAMGLSQELSSERGGVSGRTTCVCAHPVHEKLVSGTSTGEVHLWDLRSAASLVFRPHPFAAGESGWAVHGVVIY
jgi:WD40 repeat protein